MPRFKITLDIETDFSVPDAVDRLYEDLEEFPGSVDINESTIEEASDDA